jgi:hypothetical protein
VKTPRALAAVVMWALLAALLMGAAACGSTDVSAPAATRTGDAGAAFAPGLAPGLAPRADEGHLGPGAIRCSRCHTPEQRGHAAWRETAMRLGHDVQSRLAEGTTCKCCHLGEVKGFGESLERVCAECHDDIRVTITGMGSMHCLSCHDLTAGGGKLMEKAWECSRCHTKDQGDKPAIHVHASQACSNCHRPHQEPWTLPRKCTECHEGHETFHGADVRDPDGGASHAVLPHDAGTFSGEPMACATCHRPHEVGGAASGRCYECHAEKSPATFTPATTFAGSHERCTTCHVPHGEANAGPVPCRSCHTAVVTLNGRASEAHSRCVNCHEPHDVRGTPARACAGCHAAVHIAHPDPEGKGCVGCHEPHPGPRVPAVVAAAGAVTPPDASFAKAASPVTCSRCHTGIVTMDGPASEAHGNCANCHQMHDVRRTPAGACAGCHAAVHVEHPDPGGKGCVGCHEPHPGGRGRAVAAATGETSSPKAPSPVTCSHCHTAAGTDLGFHDGTTTCAGCHVPHAFTAATAPACATCHARETAAAVTAGGHGHGSCKGCHQTHEPGAARPACGSCHEQEAKTTSAGHADCRGCHDAHPTGRAPEKACTSCHVAQKSGPHAAVACATCHRPHGPDAPAGPAGPALKPACSSCHAAATLGGMHAVAGHAECARCHTAHTPPSSSRGTCLACHADRKDHEPTAPVCSGCHGFARSR